MYVPINVGGGGGNKGPDPVNLNPDARNRVCVCVVCVCVCGWESYYVNINKVDVGAVEHHMLLLLHSC